MNKIPFPSLKENIYSENIEHNYHSNIKNISYKNVSASNSSLNKTSNQTYLKISSYQTGIKNQKNGASFCLNLIENQNNIKLDTNHNYTQHIILHTAKNKKIINEEESKIQKIILKSLKKEKTDINRDTKEEINFFINPRNKENRATKASQS